MNRWLGCLMGMTVVCSTPAQVRAPANPLQTLPRTEMPQQAPSVKVNVQAPNPALEALLATHLTPSRFDVIGVKSIRFADVAAIFAPMRGKDCTVRDLVAASDRVTALYKARGYALSFVAGDYGGSTTIPNSQAFTITCNLPPQTAIPYIGGSYDLDIDP